MYLSVIVSGEYNSNSVRLYDYNTYSRIGSYNLHDIIYYNVGWYINNRHGRHSSIPISYIYNIYFNL